MCRHLVNCFTWKTLRAAELVGARDDDWLLRRLPPLLLALGGPRLLLRIWAASAVMRQLKRLLLACALPSMLEWPRRPGLLVLLLGPLVVLLVAL